MSRLSPLDAGFLHIEDPVSQMHIGAAAIMQGPAPPYGRLCAMVAGKLAAIPRCRQVVQHVPLDLGLPVWVDYPYFQLRHHLRQAALPPGGGDRMSDLEAWVGELMSRPMDRSRPLWELWMVEGLSAHRWAVVAKVHHCMVDGVSGSDLLGLILDVAPEPDEVDVPEWEPSPSPSQWDLAREGLADLLSGPIRLVRSMMSMSLSDPPSAEVVSKLLEGLASTSDAVRGVTGTSLNGPIGPDRRWTTTSVRVDQVNIIRRRLGGTFNDVMLAATSRGFKELLRSREEEVDSPLRSVVPVSLRARDSKGMAIGDGTLANRVSLVFGELPVQLADTPAMLDRIIARTVELKKANEADAIESVLELGELTPPPLLAWMLRIGSRLSQKIINTVTTNVPGPQIPLYAAGCRMLEVFPYVPLAMEIRIGVAILSYDGAVGVGVTGDYQSAPDIAVVCRGFDLGIHELLDAASVPKWPQCDRPECDGPECDGELAGNAAATAKLG
jgi:diacylglycerol O-acyltransferase